MGKVAGGLLQSSGNGEADATTPSIQNNSPLSRGHSLLQWKKINSRGSLPQSEGAKYTLTYIDAVSGVLQAYLVPQADQTNNTALYVTPHGKWSRSTI